MSLTSSFTSLSFRGFHQCNQLHGIHEVDCGTTSSRIIHWMKDCTVKTVRMHFLKHKTTYLILNSLNSILQWDSLSWLSRMWLTKFPFPEIQQLVHRIRTGWTKSYSLKTIISYQSPYSRKKPALLQNQAECLRGSVLKIQFQFEYFDFWATWLHPDFVVQTSRLCRPENQGRAFSAGVLHGPVVHTNDTFRSPVFYAASPHASAWNRLSWFNQAKLSQWWASSLSLSFQCANSGSWQPRRSLAKLRGHCEFDASVSRRVGRAGSQTRIIGAIAAPTWSFARLGSLTWFKASSWPVQALRKARVGLNVLSPKAARPSIIFDPIQEKPLEVSGKIGK